jgi:hypothetical protein
VWPTPLGRELFCQPDNAIVCEKRYVLTRESVRNSILVVLGEDYCVEHALNCRLLARAAITIELVPIQLRPKSSDSPVTILSPAWPHFTIDSLLVLVQLRWFFPFPFASRALLGANSFSISPSHMPAGLCFSFGLDPVVWFIVA